jgi:hypothetical protein
MPITSRTSELKEEDLKGNLVFVTVGMAIRPARNRTHKLGEH